MPPKKKVIKDDDDESGGNVSKVGDTIPPSTTDLFVDGNFMHLGLIEHLFTTTQQTGFIKPFMPTIDLRVQFNSGFIVDFGTDADPDAPIPYTPTERSVIHYAVKNIPGKAGKFSKGVLGEPLMTYTSPNPEKGSHRYVFLLLEQPGVLDYKIDSKKRKGFNVAEFIDEYKLKPVGVNFFSMHE